MGNMKEREVTVDGFGYQEHSENVVPMLQAEIKPATSEDDASPCCGGCMRRGAVFGVAEAHAAEPARPIRTFGSSSLAGAT